MKLKDLKVVEDNINLDDYYYLYDLVKKNMDNPDFLGVIPRNEVEDILKGTGKIWIYYDNDTIVCSCFYIPTDNNLLRKHNCNYDSSITGSLGPIMVRKEYVGNGFMTDMMDVLESYAKKLGNKYIFTKAAKDNIYSTRNMIKNGYEIIDEYENERGMNVALIKKL